MHHGKSPNCPTAFPLPPTLIIYTLSPHRGHLLFSYGLLGVPSFAGTPIVFVRIIIIIIIIFIVLCPTCSPNHLSYIPEIQHT